MLMRKTLLLLAVLLFATSAFADPIPCFGVTSTGAVNLCNPGQTYGVMANTTATKILFTDGNRTSFWIQCGGSTGTIIAFNDVAEGTNTPYNGMELVPTVTAQPPSFYWTNMPQGNTPGRVVTSSVSIVSLGGSNPCAFFFTQ